MYLRYVSTGTRNVSKVCSFVWVFLYRNTLQGFPPNSLRVKRYHAAVQMSFYMVAEWEHHVVSSSPLHSRKPCPLSLQLLTARPTSLDLLPLHPLPSRPLVSRSSWSHHIAAQFSIPRPLRVYMQEMPSV